jgi:hypothetical protein
MFVRTAGLLSLIILPATALSETALDRLAGDWGLEMTHGMNCNVAPMRLKLAEEGQVILNSLINQKSDGPAQFGQTERHLIVSIEKDKILVQEEGSSGQLFYSLSNDGNSLFYGPLQMYDLREFAPIFTRCPLLEPTS